MLPAKGQMHSFHPQSSQLQVPQPETERFFVAHYSFYCHFGGHSWVTTLAFPLLSSTYSRIRITFWTCNRLQRFLQDRGTKPPGRHIASTKVMLLIVRCDMVFSRLPWGGAMDPRHSGKGKVYGSLLDLNSLAVHATHLTILYNIPRIIPTVCVEQFWTWTLGSLQAVRKWHTWWQWPSLYQCKKFLNFRIYSELRKVTSGTSKPRRVLKAKVRQEALLRRDRHCPLSMWTFSPANCLSVIGLDWTKLFGRGKGLRKGPRSSYRTKETWH